MLKSVLLMIFLTNLLNNQNIICIDDSTTECILKTIKVTSDFKFDFPHFTERKIYKITGKNIKIDCEEPCSLIEFKVPFTYQDDVEFNLENSQIFGERVIFHFKGKLNLINSLISSTNKSTKYTRTTLDCVSTSGYCYAYDFTLSKKIYIPLNVIQNHVVENFVNYIDTLDYKMLKFNIGVAKDGTGLKGGGQVMVYVDDLVVDNSSLEANFEWNDKNTKDISKKKSLDKFYTKKKNSQNNLLFEKIKIHFRKTKIREKIAEKKILAGGTGGYLFIIANTITIKNTKTFLKALGSCYEETSSVIKASSSSGNILIQAIQVFKDNEKNEIDLEELVNFIESNNYCYTSSSGIIFLKNNSKNFLGFIYEKKVELKNGNIFEKDLTENEKNLNNFKLYIDNKTIIDKILIKNLSIDISFVFKNTEQTINIKKIEINNSKKTSVLSDSPILIFDEVVVNNSENFENKNDLVIINKVVNLLNSKIYFARVFFNGANCQIEASFLQALLVKYYDDADYPKNFENFQNLDFLKKNIDYVKNYSFISSNNSDFINLSNTSKIRFSMILLIAKKIEIKNSFLQANFMKKAVVKKQNSVCGYSGTNNGGLGFFNFKTKNIFCIKNWLIKNRKYINMNENNQKTFSSVPVFILKKDFIKLEILVQIGGLIQLKGEELFLDGKVVAKGVDSSEVEKIYIGSSSGGIIEIEFNKYTIAKDSLFDVSGGRGNYPMGPSGGGKIFIFYSPPENTILNEVKPEKKKNFNNSLLKEKNNNDVTLYNEMRIEFFNLGYDSFDSANSYDFPNPIWSFFNSNKEIFNGKLYNKYICKPGYFGKFCSMCPLDKFKPFYGFDDCLQCPCQIEKSLLYKPSTNPLDCPCKKKSFIENYFLELILIFGFFSCFCIYYIQQIKMTKNENDSIFLLNINDFPNICHKILCYGLNEPNHPFFINKSDFNFILNDEIFCKKFNNICKYNNLEKILFYIVFIVNLVPSYFLLGSVLKFNKLNKIKKFLKDFVFLTKTYQNFNIKIIVSKNISNLTVVFLNSEITPNSHEFSFKYPYSLNILGNGTFHHQFKFDLKNPINILFIKNIKRNIKNEDFNLTNILPSKLLIKEPKMFSNKNLHSFDNLFAYLNVLLATLQFKIPFTKLKKRILRLEIFMHNLNCYLNDYGFKFVPFFKFKLLEEFYNFEFFSLINFGNKIAKKFIHLYNNPEIFCPFLFIEVQRIERIKPISIIFPFSEKNEEKKNFNIKKIKNIKTIAKTKTVDIVDFDSYFISQNKNEDKNNLSKSQKITYTNEDNNNLSKSQKITNTYDLYFERQKTIEKNQTSLLNLNSHQEKKNNSKNMFLIHKIKKVFKKIIIPKKSKIKIIFVKLRNIIKKFFWRYFTYHNCNKNKFSYRIFKIIFIITVIAFKVVTFQVLSINDNIINMLIFPPFIDEITIALLILQIFLNKKKLAKFIIYSSFLNFIKSILICCILFFLLGSDMNKFIFFYFGYSFCFLLLSYFNCYIISFDLFYKSRKFVQNYS